MKLYNNYKTARQRKSRKELYNTLYEQLRNKHKKQPKKYTDEDDEMKGHSYKIRNRKFMTQKYLCWIKLKEDNTKAIILYQAKLEEKYMYMQTAGIMDNELILGCGRQMLEKPYTPKEDWGEMEEEIMDGEIKIPEFYITKDLLAQLPNPEKKADKKQWNKTKKLASELLEQKLRFA